MRLIFLILVVCSVMFAPSGAAARDKKPRAPRETREERLRETERRNAEKATAAVADELKKGRKPSYNNLIKSTNYELMYEEGLRYYHARKRGKDYNTSQNYTRAQHLLDAAMQSQTFTGTVREDSLAYYLGCSFYKNKDFATSESIFDTFRRRHPRSVFIEPVEYMYAMGFYFASPDPSYDQTLTVRAMEAIREYMGRYPDPKTISIEECNERLAELQQKLYAKSFENARLYVTIGQYRAAVKALSNAIDEYPESPYREELMYLAAKSAYLLAKNSVSSLQPDRYMAMMDHYYDLISEFPETEHLKEIERMHTEAKNYIEKHNQNGK